MNCAIIGSTKIAEVHINELIKNNIKEIFIISRYKHKRIRIVKKFKKKFKNIKIFGDKIEILKKKKFNIINICAVLGYYYMITVLFFYMIGLKFFLAHFLSLSDD